jgi:hypothetical protein
MIILFSKITKEVKFIDQESKRDSFSELAYINLKFKEFCILCELEEVEGKYLFSIREQKCILHFEEDINELLVLLESWFTDLYIVRVTTQGIGLGLYLHIEESK